jgi:hypothetical protein
MQPEPDRLLAPIKPPEFSEDQGGGRRYPEGLKSSRVTRMDGRRRRIARSSVKT